MSESYIGFLVIVTALGAIACFVGGIAFTLVTRERQDSQDDIETNGRCCRKPRGGQ